MKKVALFLVIVGGFTLASCSGKKTTNNSMAGPDTTVIVMGEETVTPVDSDSVMVTVQDTAIEVVTEPLTPAKTAK